MTEKLYYDVILCLPCEDSNDENESEEESQTIVELVVRFRDQEQYEELEDVGVFGHCLEDFNQALAEGKGEYDEKKTDLEKKVKRKFYVCDAGIEMKKQLETSHRMSIDVDFSEKFKKEKKGKKRKTTKKETKNSKKVKLFGIKYPKVKRYQVDYAFDDQGEHDHVCWDRFETKYFKTLEECFEHIANHEKKNEMKLIEIKSSYIVTDYQVDDNISHIEYITHFLWNINKERLQINSGFLGLVSLIPNYKSNN